MSWQADATLETVIECRDCWCAEDNQPSYYRGVFHPGKLQPQRYSIIQLCAYTGLGFFFTLYVIICLYISLLDAQPLHSHQLHHHMHVNDVILSTACLLSWRVSSWQTVITLTTAVDFIVPHKTFLER